MALDTTGVYTAGDDIRTIDALGLPFGEYVLTCVQNSLNQLEDMSSTAATNLLDELTAYETAESAQTTQDLADVEGKTLVKADVLEWQVKAGQPSGPQAEMLRAQQQIKDYLAFSTCLGGFMNSSSVSTTLIRS